MSDPKANPFQHAGLWYWTDEGFYFHGPYHTQREALWALMRYIDPPWYAKLGSLLRSLWHDTRG